MKMERHSRFAPRKPWSTGIAETFSFGKWLVSIYLIVDKLSLLQRLLHGDVAADEEVRRQPETALAWP